MWFLVAGTYFQIIVYDAATNAAVLDKDLLAKLKPELGGPLRPMKAAFDKNYAKKTSHVHHVKAGTRYELAQQVIEDIQNFKEAMAA